VYFPVIAWIIINVFCANTLLQLEQILLFVGRGVCSNVFAVLFIKVYGLKTQTYLAVRLINSGCIQKLKVKNIQNLTLRLLMSYINGAPIFDVSRSHTTTHHSL